MSKYINCFDNKEDFSSKFVKHKTDIVYIKENKLKLYDNNIYDYLIYIPLSFEILEDGTVGSTFDKTIHYRLNNSNNWNLFTSNVSVKNGDIISFKGDNYQYGGNNGNVNSYIFNTTCKFNIYGNIMSLINSTNFSNLKTIPSSYSCFRCLFYNCTNLISAKNLILPATTLGRNCYQNMFENCTSLITGPELPAIILSNLCYYEMFKGCTSLVTAPQLPATTLAEWCYLGMFSDCVSLTTAPELPATTLVVQCYYQMFYGCINLTKAPELPAPILTLWCYNEMFYGCTKLNYIKCLATSMDSNGSTNDWVKNVSGIGTFIKDENTTWPTGDSGIPSGWTVQDAA